ncbi:MAG: MipA/OmpV family protein [Sphingomonas sp.]|uniref:MipA/OmpV family protein n=1 Tax=Sphingomonas sp. TaxID=28214 RepID=UPI00183ABEB6|nr:MipA/OmpV family protein [Sphingomonas sp.]MBA3667582.1 MipA/OmpV family protein [Sphingomonas sp.]
MLKTLTAAAALLAAAPALAQSDSGALPDPNDQSDTVTIAAGGAYLPDYEGSDDYRFIPAAAVRARVGGISIFTRATYLYVDFIPRGAGKLEFDAGPIVGVRLNRTGKIKDDFVDRLPERDKAIEVGGFVGVTYHGLTNPYDALSVRLDVVKAVAGAHKSTIFSPTIDFGTPLSRTTYVGLSLSADWVGGGYADYYYSISPSDSLASGLPVYNADGGFKDWKIGLLANQSVTGDLTHGLSLFGTASYSHLSGDFKRSPIVDDRGSASQWLVAAGLAYTF